MSYSYFQQPKQTTMQQYMKYIKPTVIGVITVPIGRPRNNADCLYVSGIILGTGIFGFVIPS